MLKSEAIADIQRKLGLRTDQESNILAELKSAQARFEQQGIRVKAGGGELSGTFLPWFLLTEIAETLAQPNEERVAIPADFLREWEHGSLWLVDTTDGVTKWIGLQKEDLEAVKHYTGAGKPEIYALDYKYFRLGPAPDQPYSLRMVYYAPDEKLGAADTENRWLRHAPDLLIGEAGWHMAMALRDSDAMQLFVARRDETRSDLYAQHEAREHENRRYVMGGLED